MLYGDKTATGQLDSSLASYT